MIKQRKNGSYSVKLDAELWLLTFFALQNRLQYDYKQMPAFEYWLLEEVEEKLGNHTSGILVLKKSEVFVLFHPDTMRYLEESTQILIKEALNPLSKILFHHKTTCHGHT